MDLFNNALDPGNREAWIELQETESGSEELLYNCEEYGRYLAMRNRTSGNDINSRERFGITNYSYKYYILVYYVSIEGKPLFCWRYVW